MRGIITKIKEEKIINSMEVSMSELLYLCFFGLMLFAKGIGLYDGQTVYKIFLVLAFLCIAAKMCITEYSVQEWAWILSLLALSTIIYRISGEKGVLICMVTVVAMKNVSVKRAFQVGLIVWSAAMGGRFLWSLIFLKNVETAVQTKNIFGAVLRYFMGYPHPNVLHISYLVLAAMIIYCVKDNYSLKHLLGLFAGNIFLFFYSYSFTGAFIVIIYICLSYYVCRKKINRFEYFLVRLVFPFCLLFSVLFPVILQGKLYEMADKIFNNRINFARHFLTLENMSLFGNNLAAITTDIITMDNSFLFALIIYGIPVFILICIGYFGTINSFIQQKRNIELAMICCFFAAGITEPFLFNTSFKNLTLLFLGEYFFSMLCRKNQEKRFAILKKCDRSIMIPAARLQTIVMLWKQVWSSHKKMILGLAAGAAFIAGICAGFFYRAVAAVLEVQQGNLLIYERIRVVLTVFFMTAVAAGVVASIGYCILDDKTEKKQRRQRQ